MAVPLVKTIDGRPDAGGQFTPTPPPPQHDILLHDCRWSITCKLCPKHSYIWKLGLSDRDIIRQSDELMSGAQYHHSAPRRDPG